MSIEPEPRCPPSKVRDPKQANSNTPRHVSALFPKKWHFVTAFTCHVIQVKNVLFTYLQCDVKQVKSCHAKRGYYFLGPCAEGFSGQVQAGQARADISHHPRFADAETYNIRDD